MSGREFLSREVARSKNCGQPPASRPGVVRNLGRAERTRGKEAPRQKGENGAESGEGGESREGGEGVSLRNLKQVAIIVGSLVIWCIYLYITSMVTYELNSLTATQESIVSMDIGFYMGLSYAPY